MTSQPTCAFSLMFAFAFLMSPSPSFSSCQTSDLNMFSFTLAQHAQKVENNSSSTATHKKGAKEGLKHLLRQQTHHTVQAQSSRNRPAKAQKGPRSVYFCQLKFPASPLSPDSRAPEAQHSVPLIQPFLTGLWMSPGYFQLQTEPSSLASIFIILYL